MTTALVLTKGSMTSGASLLVSLALFACGQAEEAPGSIPAAPEATPVQALPAPEVHRSLVLDRVIAGKDGAENLTFGLVRHIAVESTGSVVIEDAMGRAVVRVGADGEFKDSLGRRGPGPGEYRYPFGVAALPDGSVAVRDDQPPSIVLFDARGDFIREWSLFDRLKFSNGLDVELSADPSGQLRLLLPFERTPDMYEIPDVGFVTLAPTGEIIDSVAPPITPWDGAQVWGEYHPRKHVAWHPDGFLVAGMSDAYRLEFRRPEGTVRIERPYEPVPVSPEEQASHEAVMAWQRSRGAVDVDDRPAPPDFKAAYSRILIASTGEVWVFRHGTGEQWGTRDLGQGLSYPLFREPIQADVFDAEGRFIQTVEGDSSIDPKVISGDTVWAVVTGEQQEHYVARYLVR